jgi:N-acyl-D-amino-acid deacylase
MDILIRNGRLADGTGNPLYPGDVMIDGDRIAAVERLPQAQARRTIDARGKIVCPGFIDCHSHTDWTIHTNPTMQSTIRQGVTTEIVGNCGFSMAPVSDISRNHIEGILKYFAYEQPATWSSFAEYLDTVAKMKTTANLAWFVGHSAIRAAVGVTVPSKEVTIAQMQAMQDHVKEAMDAGALGLSTGLEYEPGRTASTDEVIQLAKVAGADDGMYASHIRNYDEDLQTAVEEFVQIVKQSKTRGQLSHLNVRENTGAPQGAWGRAVDTLMQGRANGLELQTDCVGYKNGIGKPASILPPWVMAEGPHQAALKLKDPAVRKRLRKECDRYWRFLHRGDWHRVRIVQEKPFPEIVGKNLEEIAELWQKDPWECFFDIMVAAGAGMDDLTAVGMLFTDEHVAEMVSNPLFSLEADIVSSDLDSPLRDKLPFKASYAGMIHFLTWHARQRNTLRLEDVVRKMTSMPATHFGLRERGLLRKGYFADVVVLDYEKLDDGATDSRPFAYARGVEHVIVNGRLVIDHSEHTGARPGRNLLRSLK